MSQTANPPKPGAWIQRPGRAGIMAAWRPTWQSANKRGARLYRWGLAGTVCLLYGIAQSGVAAAQDAQTPGKAALVNPATPEVPSAVGLALIVATGVAIALAGFLLLQRSRHRDLQSRYARSIDQLQQVRQENGNLSRKLTQLENRVLATRNWADEVSEDLTAILETIDYGVFVLDANLRAQFANRTYREMWSFDEVFIAQRPTFAEILEECRRQGYFVVDDAIWPTYREERIDSIRDGDQKPEDVERGDGSIIRRQCVRLPGGRRLLTFLDITESWRQTDAVRQSEQRFKAFAEAASDHFWETDSEHRFLYLSQSTSMSTMADKKSMIGLTRWNTPGVIDSEREKLEQHRVVLDRHQAFEDFEYSRTDLHGRIRHWSVSGKPRFGPDGQFVGYVGVGREITAQVEKELQLREALHDAEVANQAKSEFLAVMSHELRTPLNGILGMAGVLAHSKLDDEQRVQLQTVRESGETLLALLNDILDLSKIEAGHLELEQVSFDLQGLLDSVSAVWKSRVVSKGLNYEVKIDARVERCLKSDPSRIRQILFNLVGNAYKFTDNGAIVISVFDAPESRPNRGSFLLRFEVSDTGIGISPAARKRLFTKFTQADSSTTRKYGGTGLGLAICRELTKHLGGKVGLESAEGLGSTFWFTIRCEAGDPAQLDRELWLPDATSLPSSVSGRRLRILVAEDNHVNQAVIKAILRGPDFALDFVGNGLEAISAVMRAPYDLILMDVQMPEMDGVTATRRIRELDGRAAATPIIALTANAMAGDRETYLAAGMDFYVSKPIDPGELFSAIDKATVDKAPCLPCAPAPLAAPVELPLAQTKVSALEDLMDQFTDLADEA